MRDTTKRAYEKRIADLIEEVETHRQRAASKSAEADMWETSYRRLQNERRQGEHARSWAVDQAINAGRQHDIVVTAKQIADYVYGPDFGPDREAENA